MSIMFGILKTDGSPVLRDELCLMAQPTAQHATVGTSFHVNDNIGFGFQFSGPIPKEPKVDAPLDLRRDIHVQLDGRLDNRLDLLKFLPIEASNLPDERLIEQAFLCWQEQLFEKLVGEWAVSIWNKQTQTLYLARDHAGSRSLYFERVGNTVRWSTYLDTFFALPSDRSINDAYIASYLCGDASGDQSPYRNISPVPPAHYVCIQNGRFRRAAYWSPLSIKTISYRSEQEYDEQFLHLFRQAVERRSPLGEPVVAELSGGMDSTSIVCMSDLIRESNAASTSDLIDTVSYLAPREPNWNEQPYIAVTEKKRGKVGVHLEVPNAEDLFLSPEMEPNRSLLPGATKASVDFQRKRDEKLKDLDCRTILSGIGGDELLGGVPTPMPELADDLVSFHFLRLFKRGLAWSLANRLSLFELLPTVAQFTFRLYRDPIRENMPAPSWLNRRFAKQVCEERRENLSIIQRLKLRPSILSNNRTWSSITATLPNLHPGVGIRYEYRYPYLDRDLVEFLFGVPRHLLLQPGRRRALMRRTLTGIVPIELLERRRKAYISYGPLLAMQQKQTEVAALIADPLLAEYGFVDRNKLQQAFKDILEGRDVETWPLFFKAISVELWLRSLDQAEHLRSMGSPQHQTLPDSVRHSLSVRAG